MKTLKQIVNVNSITKTTVTLSENDEVKPFLIETIIENKKEKSYKTINEEYKDYFRAQYRFLQLAMLYLS